MAAQNGLRLRPRGEGHSTAGQAQVSDGVVVDMRGLDAVAVANGHAVAQAGARWSAVLATSLPLGLTPPVLTDYLELSVGGTLSVGGIGGMTHRHGMQVDNVTALEVLTPDGTIHTCAPGSTLFDAVRGSHGEHGIILRATLRLIPAPARVRRHKLRFTDLGSFLSAQRALMAERRFDSLKGRVLADRTFEISAVTYTNEIPTQPVDETEERDYADFASRAELEGAEKPHPWLNLFLPDTEVEQFLTDFLASGDDVGPLGTTLAYPFDTRLITAPEVRLPRSDVAFLVALLRTAESPASLTRMAAANEKWRQRTLEVGGRVYLDRSGTP
nr:putative oxidoreductase [Kibdelosporangium sp. MJ126-NF4]